MVTPQDRSMKPELLEEKAKERVAIGQKWQNERQTFTTIEIFCLKGTWDPLASWRENQDRELKQF